MARHAVSQPCLVRARREAARTATPGVSGIVAPLLDGRATRADAAELDDVVVDAKPGLPCRRGDELVAAAIVHSEVLPHREQTIVWECLRPATTKASQMIEPVDAFYCSCLREDLKGAVDRCEAHPDAVARSVSCSC